MSRGGPTLLPMVVAIGLVAAACIGSSDVSSPSASTASEAEVATTLDVTDAASTEPPDDPTGPTIGGTLIVGLEEEARGLRPWEDTFSSSSYNIAAAIYDKLMEQTADGEYVGWAAASLQPNDSLDVWTMTLRDGMTFTNGTEVTGQTIADMFVVQQTGATGAGEIAASALVDVGAEGNVVVYTLSRANAAFPSHLSRAPLGMIFDPEAASSGPDDFADVSIGSGPFMIERRDVDGETVLVRNPDYWMTDAAGTELPYLDSLVFRPIPTEQARLDALTAGTIDAFHTSRPETIRNARDIGGTRVFESLSSNTFGGIFNVLVAPYDDLRVRKGLTLNNPQDAVVSALGGDGVSVPARSWFSVESAWYSDVAASTYPEFDPAAGTAMLQEYVDDPARSDGKAVGEPITVDLSCPADPTLIAAMQVLEQAWTATGLVEVNMIQFDLHLDSAVGEAPDYIGRHGAHCWRFGDDHDPATSMRSAWAPVEESPANVSNFFDDEMYGWILEASATADVEARYDLYEKVDIRINEQQPIWYSGATTTAFAAEANVDGIDRWYTPDGDLGVGFLSAEGRWSQVYVAAG